MKKINKIVAAMSHGRTRTLSIINGVIGDTLAAKKTGLAIQMALHIAEGTPLCVTQKGLQQAGLMDLGRICILAHGSCGSENGWGFKEEKSTDYGTLLQKDFGFTPLYLRYNSGLHISTNGKQLSDLLEKYVRWAPQKVTDIVLLGHSMGGLVFRSACYYGQKDKRRWPKLIRKIFYVGSPHLGTHLEKLGKLTVTIFKKIPHPATQLFVALGDLRSAGVKDLRHGYIIDSDWKNKNADNLLYWHQNKTPPLKTAAHYLICGTLSKVEGSRLGRWFGDGLVHPASGTGQGLFSSSAIPFPREHCKVIAGISHQRLLRSRRVYEQIRQWCQE